MASSNTIVKYFINYSAIVLASVAIFSLEIILHNYLSLEIISLLLIGNVIFGSFIGDKWLGFTAGILSLITLAYFSFFYTQALHIIMIEKFLYLILFAGEAFFITIFVTNGKHYKIIGSIKQEKKEYITKIDALKRDIEDAKQEILSRDEFLSIASHELKTPLTSVLLQIQTALHNIRNVSLAQFSVENLLNMLQSTENQTKRLSKMINDFLNISLIATGRMDLEKEEIDLSIMLFDIISDFKPRFEREEYEVEQDIEKNVVGNWDKLRIEQTITNLISNAVKYGNKKPISISLKKNNSDAIITISDQGIGMSKGQKDRIFRLFQRGVQSNQYKGLGVGLYIADQIVGLHGGSIKVQSEEGKGSSFSVRLPLKNNSK